MALIKWEPRREMEPLRSLRDEVDRLFDSFFRGWPRPWSGESLLPGLGEFAPSIDLKEDDKELVLTAELPGIAKENLDVNITEDSVTIKGERKEDKEEQAKGYHFRESSYGSFHRVIPLPVEVVADKATAKLKDGVLTLNLPKSKASKRKGVQIKVE
jgi:HSP20 family protein